MNSDENDSGIMDCLLPICLNLAATVLSSVDSLSGMGTPNMRTSMPLVEKDCQKFDFGAAMFPKYVRTFTQAVEQCSTYAVGMPEEYVRETAYLQRNTSPTDGLYPLYMEKAKYYEMNGPCYVATSSQDLVLFGIIYIFLSVFVFLCVVCLGSLLLTAFFVTCNNNRLVKKMVCVLVNSKIENKILNRTRDHSDT